MNFEQWYRMRRAQGQGEMVILPLPGDDPVAIQVEGSDGIASVWVLQGEMILAWPFEEGKPAPAPCLAPPTTQG